MVLICMFVWKKKICSVKTSIQTSNIPFYLLIPYQMHPMTDAAITIWSNVRAIYFGQNLSDYFKWHIYFVSKWKFRCTVPYLEVFFLLHIYIYLNRMEITGNGSDKVRNCSKLGSFMYWTFLTCILVKWFLRCENSKRSSVILNPSNKMSSTSFHRIFILASRICQIWICDFFESINKKLQCFLVDNKRK